MIINNKKAATNFQLRRLLVLFLLTVIIVLLYNLRLFHEPFLGIERNVYTILFVIVYMIYYLTGIVRNHHFFLYSDNGSKLVFRFYSLRPMTKKQSAIEIDKTLFTGFSISNSWFGFIRRLYLSQRMPNDTIANYKPISISLLNRKQIKDLERSLLSYGK